MKKSKDELLLQLFIAAQGCLETARCTAYPGISAPYRYFDNDEARECLCKTCVPLRRLQNAVEDVRKGTV